MEPAPIAGLAEQREAIFSGIAEGVVSMHMAHRIVMVNLRAQQLLALPSKSVGISLEEWGVEGRLRDVLTGSRDDEPDALVIRSGRVLVLNRMPVRLGGRELGSVTTLRDRTELAELEREIGAFRGTTDLLRAKTTSSPTSSYHLRAHSDRGLRRGGGSAGTYPVRQSR